MSRKTAQPSVFSWPSKIVGYGEADVAAIVNNPLNWRVHPPTQMEPLLGLLETVGIVQNILINKRSDPQWGEEQSIEVMVDGHARVLLAQQHGQPIFPVTYVDLTPNEEAQVLAMLDPLVALAESHQEHLRHLLEQVSTENAVVQDFLSSLAQREGITPPEFEPAGIEDQGQLDQKKPITCPACGTEFMT